MNTITTTAIEAIDRSISHNEVAYCIDTQANRDRLFFECDDYVDTGEVVDYWGGNGDDEWRVHIRLA